MVQKDNLQIGINEVNQLVSIFDVKTGKQCNCTCPKCGVRLIAKNKDKKFNVPLKEGQKIAHFSHANGIDCPGAQETAIHLLAKKVLSESKRLLVPPLKIGSVNLTLPKIFVFEKVYTEQLIIKNDIKIQPDSILEKGKTQLYIEFFKTHAVDDFKIDKIMTLGVSCLEININGIEPIKNGMLNIKDIKYVLENDLDSKRWLYNRQTEKKYEEYKLQLELQEAEIRKKELEKDRLNKEQEENIRIINIEKERQIAQRITELNELGYKLYKVYRFHEYYYNENSNRLKREKSFEEKVFCPKVKINGKNQITDLSECLNCEFHKTIFKVNYDEKNIACGFSKNLINTPEIY